ncbi:uncharacterized protein EURHEDRAFT_381908 [Aspergillus ruber CBS 135680]|uniref:Uncharacterized protein n=1 Tax=Aspergillus ruber (strain CBS 135680) TaxID=1388766 RepID=A0A017S0Y0_ASPRC|nr:uncharacterized protein EURHEDRAFT_381908 [Aspergillus ruber CBS 135680]EYE90491.1 hypothetical protein EURHEDRAFT_381908 [Aspergillus ruber CBS 135680]
MPSLAQTLPVMAALAVGSANAAMGPAFSTGPVSDDTFIREATSTLVLPKAPSGSSGDASLWVGMGTSNGDLVQSIADNWQSDDWNIYAYTLLSTGANTQMPVQGDASTASASDRVTMHYKFDDNSGNYTQTVSVNGKTVSTLSTSDGKAQGWGSSVECAEDNCGTVGAHSWTDTKIILDTADSNYINTVAKGEGVTGEMTTSDDGKTWTVSTIEIPEFSFGQSS